MTYEDRTPDDLFIKVYPKRLRALIRDRKLRRAEIGELLLLALRIDQQNQCWPSKQDSAMSVGMKSGNWARKLQTKLQEKGVINWDFDHDRRSPRFQLPDAFYFGRDSYRERNTESGGVRNTAPRGVRNTESRGVRNTVPEQESSSEENPGRRKPHTDNNSAGLSLKENGREVVLPPLPSKSQRKLIRRLKDAGVSDIEAYLIGLQYKPATIDKAIADSQAPSIRNRGGWIRRTVELIAGEAVAYPAMNRRDLAAKALMAVMAAQQTSLYEPDDEYGPDDPNNSADGGDTPDNSAQDGDTSYYNSGSADTDNSDGANRQLPF